MISVADDEPAGKGGVGGVSAVDEDEAVDEDCTLDIEEVLVMDGCVRWVWLLLLLRGAGVVSTVSPPTPESCCVPSALLVRRAGISSCAALLEARPREVGLGVCPITP